MNSVLVWKAGIKSDDKVFPRVGSLSLCLFAESVSILRGLGKTLRAANSITPLGMHTKRIRKRSEGWRDPGVSSGGVVGPAEKVDALFNCVKKRRIEIYCGTELYIID